MGVPNPEHAERYAANLRAMQDVIDRARFEERAGICVICGRQSWTPHVHEAVLVKS